MLKAFQKKEHEFLAQLHKSCPQLLQTYPLEFYCSRLKDKVPFRNYETIPEGLSTQLNDIKHNYGSSMLALYHKAGICQLVVEFLHQSGSRQLPTNIDSLYHECFERLYKDFSSMPDAYYDHEKIFSQLRKDLAICSGQAIPVGGAWLVQLKSIRIQDYIQNALRIDPNRISDEDGPPSADYSELSRRRGADQDRDERQTLKKMLTAVKKQIGKQDKVNAGFKKMITAARKATGQYNWFYVIHTVERNIQDFTSAKMDLAYRNIAELLKKDHRIWGIFRESWFLDPYLKQISPELSFLWEVPIRNGASLYYGGPYAMEHIQKIILLSPARNQAYREGRYSPARYFFLWPRDNVLNGKFDASKR